MAGLPSEPDSCPLPAPSIRQPARGWLGLWTFPCPDPIYFLGPCGCHLAGAPGRNEKLDVVTPTPCLLHSPKHKNPGMLGAARQERRTNEDRKRPPVPGDVPRFPGPRAAPSAGRHPTRARSLLPGRCRGPEEAADASGSARGTCGSRASKGLAAHSNPFRVKQDIRREKEKGRAGVAGGAGGRRREEEPRGPGPGPGPGPGRGRVGAGRAAGALGARAARGARAAPPPGAAGRGPGSLAPPLPAPPLSLPPPAFPALPSSSPPSRPPSPSQTESRTPGRLPAAAAAAAAAAPGLPASAPPWPVLFSPYKDGGAGSL